MWAYGDWTTSCAFVTTAKWMKKLLGMTEVWLKNRNWYNKTDLDTYQPWNQSGCHISCTLCLPYLGKPIWVIFEINQAGIANKQNVQQGNATNSQAGSSSFLYLDPNLIGHVLLDVLDIAQLSSSFISKRDLSFLRGSSFINRSTVLRQSLQFD